MAVAISQAQTFPDKASKKDYKMMKRSTAMNNAERANAGRKSAKELDKMAKKEDKMNQKAGKYK
jgi:hypothetical protein